jgi:hypothetical protein
VGYVCVFGVNIEFFHDVEMGAFSMVMWYLHDFVDGTKGVCLVEKVLCETGGWGVAVKSMSMLLVA